METNAPVSDTKLQELPMATPDAGGGCPVSELNQAEPIGPEGDGLKEMEDEAVKNGGQQDIQEHDEGQGKNGGQRDIPEHGEGQGKKKRNREKQDVTEENGGQGDEFEQNADQDESVCPVLDVQEQDCQEGKAKVYEDQQGVQEENGQQGTTEETEENGSQESKSELDVDQRNVQEESANQQDKTQKTGENRGEEVEKAEYEHQYVLPEETAVDQGTREELVIQQEFVEDIKSQPEESTSEGAGGQQDLPEKFECEESGDQFDEDDEDLSSNGLMSSSSSEEGVIYSRHEGSGEWLSGEASNTLETEEVPDDVEVSAEMLEDMQKEHESLTQMNRKLQAVLVEHFHSKETPDEEDLTELEYEERYLAYSAMWEKLKHQQTNVMEHHSQQEQEKQQQLQETLAEVDQEMAALVKLRRQTVTPLLQKRVGEHGAQARIEKLEAGERQKEAELVQLRLKNLQLLHRLQEIQAEPGAGGQDQLGFQLMDFEQLKLEHQTYAEKLEERKEEVLRLRRRISENNQVLSHAKEKLQFMQEEGRRQRAALQDVRERLESQEKALASAKLALSRVKTDYGRLRDSMGLLGNQTLLRDFEEKVESIQELSQRLDVLKNRRSEDEPCKGAYDSVLKK